MNITYGPSVTLPVTLTDISDERTVDNGYHDYRFETVDGVQYSINLDSEFPIDTSVLNIDVLLTVGGQTARAQWCDRRLVSAHHISSQLHADNERSRQLFLDRPTVELLFITGLIRNSYRVVTRREWVRTGPLNTDQL